MSDKCPICNSWTNSFEPDFNQVADHVNCMRCGNYTIDGNVRINIHPPLNDSQIANISGWIRENQKCFIGWEQYDKLVKLKTPTVGEKAEKLFRYLANKFPIAGTDIELQPDSFNEVLIQLKEDRPSPSSRLKAEKVLPWLAISWAIDGNEFRYLVIDYLWKKHNHITMNGNVKITPEGWAYWDSLKYVNVDSQMAFIAMWFDKSMKKVDNTINKAIENAGYEPKRVDRHEHVNRIDDEIIALIRQSKFIVADYTGQRGGVYFESGFALGLGLQVVWLCKKEDRGDLHFDTNHYNFIFWEEDKLDRLQDALEKRIIAVIGKGSYNPARDN